MPAEIPINCYYCGHFYLNKKAEVQRQKDFGEGHYHVPAGISGTCLASDMDGSLVNSGGKIKVQPEHRTTSQQICHVTIYDNLAFQKHGSFEVQEYENHLSEHSKKMDGLHESDNM